MDSIFVGKSVYMFWKNMGCELVCEVLVDVDVIVLVLDFGMLVVFGFVEYIGCLYELGIICNYYVGRSFIEFI